jgi:protein gp37
MKYWDQGVTVVWGCTPVSDGCAHCWARALAARFPDTLRGPDAIDFNAASLERILQSKRPTVFALWNDLFHAAVTNEDIIEVLDVIVARPEHRFLVLTKRPERLEPLLYGEPGGWVLGGGDHLPQLWVGTSAENQATLDARAPYLAAIKEASCGAQRTFLSLEPLLGPVDLGDLYLAVDVVVVGPETGAGRRPCEMAWIEEVERQCAAAHIGVRCLRKDRPAHEGFTPMEFWR